MTIVGDAGVGKTSLVRELWDWLRAESQEPLLRSGRCLPYGRGITYWPLGEVLKEHLGMLESDPPAIVRERLGERQILGLTLGLELGPELHPLVARERLYESWVDLLDEIVAIRPAVVLIEDLHWAEEPLLDLLDRLLRDVSGPLLLLATARYVSDDSLPELRRYSASLYRDAYRRLGWDAAPGETHAQRLFRAEVVRFMIHSRDEEAAAGRERRCRRRTRQRRFGERRNRDRAGQNDRCRL